MTRHIPAEERICRKHRHLRLNSETIRYCWVLTRPLLAVQAGAALIGEGAVSALVLEKVLSYIATKVAQPQAAPQQAPLPASLASVPTVPAAPTVPAVSGTVPGPPTQVVAAVPPACGDTAGRCGRRGCASSQHPTPTGRGC